MALLSKMVGFVTSSRPEEALAFYRNKLGFQDENGVWNVPNGDRGAWFCEPDRNVLSVSQHASRK